MLLQRLVDAGEIVLTWHGTDRTWGITAEQRPGWKQAGMLTIDLSEKGREYQIGNDEPDYLNMGRIRDYPAGRFAVMKLCEKEFGGISGITMATANQAEIEYFWKFNNPTPFGKAELDTSPQTANCRPSIAGGGRVTARLYDDGWRFVR